VKAYFAAESEEELLKWSEEIIQRIRAHQRVNQMAISESDSKDSAGSSEDDVIDEHERLRHSKDVSINAQGSAKAIAAKKIGKLKSNLKVKRGSTGK
jgi:hypothetical protein